jgi:hypothetical protein
MLAPDTSLREEKRHARMVDCYTAGLHHVVGHLRCLCRFREP